MPTVLSVVKSGANHRSYPKPKAAGPARPQSNRFTGALGKFVLATSFIIPTIGHSQETKVDKANTPHTETIASKGSFEELLQTTGAKGLVHGSIPDLDMFVFTYGDLLKGEHHSLIPKNDDVRSNLQKATRHQEIKINGQVVKKGTPQQHVSVEKVELGKAWDPK
ncbi:MAG: hypothetical protein HYZ79_01475, partial [Candidatus Melainabacteria bacterium]|nr:hypothetical protein [Candidatus Melainabacteria bacterium]